LAEKLQLSLDATNLIVGQNMILGLLPLSKYHISSTFIISGLGNRVSGLTAHVSWYKEKHIS